MDVTKTIEEIMKGKVEFRMDKLANVHNVFGKVSFDDAKLEENLRTFLKTLIQSKPAGAKGIFLQSVTLATTMGPGVMVDVNEVAKI